jgi:hypothetical protein
VINGTLHLDEVMFTVVNTQRDEHYSIVMPRLIGQCQMILIIRDDEYRMEMQFNDVHIERFDVVDANHVRRHDEQRASHSIETNISMMLLLLLLLLLFQVWSSKEKQSMIELLKKTICQTIVPCSCHLSDNQEQLIDESAMLSKTVNSTGFPYCFVSDENLPRECFRVLKCPTSRAARFIGNKQREQDRSQTVAKEMLPAAFDR